MAIPLDILGLTCDALCDEIGRLHNKPGKGDYHGRALFRALYRTGAFAPETLPEFADNLSLAQKVKDHFRLSLPPISSQQTDGDTYKFLLKLDGGLESESVVIPMRNYKTLCVSSQVGCKLGCKFCETAQMGFLRNLSAAQIVAQVFIARHLLHEPIENVVFMGMGEPTDNLDAVLQAVRILSEQRGFNIPLGSITISTVGDVPGILRLAELAAKPAAADGLQHVRLAVSLNAAEDATRSELMPINRSYDMQTLKNALQRWPLPRTQDFIFIEYVLIAGVNDSQDDALALAKYLSDLRAVVNLIPYNPRRESPFARPSDESVTRFGRWLTAAGQVCRVRITKGDGTMAACGQLGNRTLSRRNKIAIGKQG